MVCNSIAGMTGKYITKAKCLRCFSDSKTKKKGEIGGKIDVKLNGDKYVAMVVGVTGEEEDVVG